MGASDGSRLASGFLQRFYDPELTPPEAESREELERRQIDRIARSLSIVIIARTMPRRLGEATDSELALDKLRARRSSHALNMSHRGWTKKKADLPISDQIRKEGAQIVWDRWLEKHVAEIDHELRCLATWAILNQEDRWGKSAVVKLENERNWITYALRD